MNDLQDSFHDFWVILMSLDWSSGWFSLFSWLWSGSHDSCALHGCHDSGDSCTTIEWVLKDSQGYSYDSNESFDSHNAKTSLNSCDSNDSCDINDSWVILLIFNWFPWLSLFLWFSWLSGF